MGQVILDMSMSLDGYISPENEEDGALHHWYFAANGQNTEIIEESINTSGATIMGRNTYNLGDKFNGFVDTPYRIPHFVVTHHQPEQAAKGTIQFTFVTDGIESALQQAKAAAGDKNVVIGGGANIAQQYLKAGLVDTIEIHLVPILLGAGIRLFEQAGQIELKKTRVIDTPDVTHLQFRVVR